MEAISGHIALLGFGEAGRAFAIGEDGDARWPALQVFDIAMTAKDASDSVRQAIADAITEVGAHSRNSAKDVANGARAILSLVTADQVEMAASSVLESLSPETLYLDFNSVAPSTKQAAAKLIEEAGGHYVDVAVMSPVLPARRNTPLRLSAPQAPRAALLLNLLGFRNVLVVGDKVGQASAVKMIRSVIVKGMEALTAECLSAAQQAGVVDQVLASLQASEKIMPWSERADYNLDRMLVHGLRRAAEMREVVKTLNELGVDASMTQGTVRHQQALGELGLKPPPETLNAKLQDIAKHTTGTTQ